MYHKNNKRVIEIAKYMSSALEISESALYKGYVPKLVKYFKKLGIIVCKSDPADKRVKILSLTEKGHELVNSLMNFNSTIDGKTYESKKEGLVIITLDTIRKDKNERRKSRK